MHAVNAQATGLARTGRILRFLMRYRGTGVFTGLDLRSSAPIPSDLEAIDQRPERFVDDLEALGPTFIKLGQALSTRPDLVGERAAENLSQLQDDLPPAPFAAK